MSDQNHAPTARAKPTVAGEEEADREIKLGEFQDVVTLTLSEAQLVIDAVITKRRKERKDRNETEVLLKTLDYLDTFARYKHKENVEAAENLVKELPGNLTLFERAQIGTLGCTSAEEAKTLIPSLADKISDEQLESVLAELEKLEEKMVIGS